MLPLIEKMHRKYLGLPIPDDWEDTERADNEYKEQIQLSEEYSAKLSKFCLEQGCQEEERMTCSQSIPCMKYAAFAWPILAEMSRGRRKVVTKEKAMAKKTIKDRADKEYRRMRDSSGNEVQAYAHFNGYYLGASEQRAIDIEKAWSWILSASVKFGIPTSEVLIAKKSFLKSMED